ncbi:MAG: HipA family kinase [Cyanobacteria bacterium P01_E01_bin.42]
MSQDIPSKNEKRLKWKKLLEQSLDCPEDPQIITDLKVSYRTAARPVRAYGIDKREYIVKGQQAGRQIINDQIIARLGWAIGAPVGEPQIVEIDSELLESDSLSEPESPFAYLTPGTAHGVVFIPECSDDREGIRFARQKENRKRFALLAVLFGWIGANDRQFIYKMSSPNLVFSVDHGHFFPSGPNWTIATLQNALEPSIDEYLRSQCCLTESEINKALEPLKALEEEKIIEAVASPPIEWEITIEERVALVEYLITRQEQISIAISLSS